MVCDVYENDLDDVHIGDPAEVHLSAFPDRFFKGSVSDISRVLDPNTRSAKVRIVLANRDGAFRPGMFAVATFRSRKQKPHLVVPATAVMRLQDKDWIFRRRPPTLSAGWRCRLRACLRAGNNSARGQGGRRAGCKRAGVFDGRFGAGQMIRLLIDFALRNRIL